jgi:hypothetical protein
VHVLVRIFRIGSRQDSAAPDKVEVTSRVLLMERQKDETSRFSAEQVSGLLRESEETTVKVFVYCQNQ